MYLKEFIIFNFYIYIQKQLSELNWDPERENELHDKRNKVLDKIQELTDQEEDLSRQLTNLDFQYSDPTSNFDRSKVKGLVAELITLDEKNYDASTALEICAGGRLYNVSVYVCFRREKEREGKK